MAVVWSEQVEDTLVVAMLVVAIDSVAVVSVKPEIVSNTAIANSTPYKCQMCRMKV